MNGVERLILSHHARVFGDGGFLELEPGRREQI
jgi:hypothetical protein